MTPLNSVNYSTFRLLRDHIPYGARKMWKVVFLLSVAVSVNTKSIYRTNCTKVFNQDQLVLESPNYPSDYPSYLDCSYQLKGLECATRFTIQLLDFYIEPSVGCVNDRLEIENNDILCGGKFGTKIYYNRNGMLTLRFHSNGEKSGRGFRILIERKQCLKEEFKDLIWAPQDLSKISLPTTMPEKSSCCQNSYTSSRFILTSPGFPSNTHPTDCIYKVYRRNSNVCRLRIHFLYFWIGEVTPKVGCSKGYLQIDGKQICGCRIGLKLTSDFDFRWGNSPKVFRFNNPEYPNRLFSGFALEIIQDECPKKYQPKDDNAKFHFYNDQNNRVIWPENKIKNPQASLIPAKLQQHSDVILSSKIVKHLYVFEMPDDDNAIASDTEKRDVEKTTYMDTFTTMLFLEESNITKCQLWGNLQWTQLTREPLWEQMIKCGTAQVSGPSSINNNKSIMRQCDALYPTQGSIKSPNYPYYYPPIANVCHRIFIQPGYCILKLKVMDFDLEDSYGCTKDYLLLGGRRYCGKNLFNTIWNWDVSRKLYEEISFVTDGYYCGRGYRAFYEQIPCQITKNPLSPSIPPPTTFPSTSCGGTINRDDFVIEVLAYNQPNCIFDIQRSRPNVCKLLMTLLDFDLACGSESFDVAERRYCGLMTGQRMTFYFNKSSLAMIYRRYHGNSGLKGLRLRITGKQISDDCYVPGVCGLLLNSTETDISKAICNYIMEKNNQTECVPLASNRIYLPYSEQQSQVNFNEVERLDKVMVKEVPCEDIADVINN